jgi:hypothetical protein
MKMKSLHLVVLAMLGLTTGTMAQVPNYLPTNGLICYWPFNGNANDESGNGNNGIVTAASLTTDNNGDSNKAYYFNSISRIENNNTVLKELIDLNKPFSIGLWFNRDSSASTGGAGNLQRVLCAFDGNNISPYKRVWVTFRQDNDTTTSFMVARTNLSTYSGISEVVFQSNTFIEPNTWHHILIIYDGNNIALFLDNIASTSIVFGTTFMPHTMGGPDNYVQGFTIGDNNQNNLTNFSGKLDEISVYNRALTTQEITYLFNESICTNNTAITPQTNSLSTGSTATFTASTSDPNPSYVWQSDFGQGFQTLNNFGNYAGANTATLNIANIQLPNHTQPFRVISSSGNCIDTSDVAIINILDTCITNVTVYDTLLTTVTDTLIINAIITGLNPPSNQNTIKVFPNPANTHITVDYGNFASMNGYTLTIVNSIGQTVFTTQINQQTSYIDLSTWTGNGIYFVQLIDPQNNTIENRKIVIQ